MATDPFSGLGPGCSLSGWMMKHMKLLPRPLLPREKLRNRGTSDGDHDHDVTMVIYKVWTHLVYQILPHLNNAEKTARPLLDLPPKTPWEYDIDPPRRGLLQGSLPCLVCFFHTRLRIAPPFSASRTRGPLRAAPSTLAHRREKESAGKRGGCPI